MTPSDSEGKFNQKLINVIPDSFRNLYNYNLFKRYDYIDYRFRQVQDCNLAFAGITIRTSVIPGSDQESIKLYCQIIQIPTESG